MECKEKVDLLQRMLASLTVDGMKQQVAPKD